MQNALALLGGFAISAVGFGVVIGSDHDLAGVLLMASGVGLALLVPRRSQDATQR